MKLEISLFGPMQILLHQEGCDTQALDIPSSKARGLIALLAKSPQLSCSRSLLRDTLWSDRGRAQASASLRQELLNLSRLHPAFEKLLVRQRKFVALSADHVSVQDTADGKVTQVFLEGIDIQDPAFEKWLQTHRYASKNPAISPIAALSPDIGNREIKRTIAFTTSAPTRDPNSFLETTLAHFIGQSLGEHIMIDVVDPAATRNIPKTTWVEVHAAPRDSSHSVVRVSVRDGPRKTLIFSDLQDVPSTDLLDINHPTLLSYCNQIVRSILDALSLRLPENTDEIETGLVAHLASRKLFAVNPKELVLSDRLFSVANDRNPRGLYFAWRAFVRSIQLIERHEGDRDLLQQEMQQFCYQALEMEPNNSTVLALVANTRLEQGDNIRACAEIAERSVKLNPSNPLAWDSLSMAALYQNDHQTAHDLAIRSQQVSAGSPHSFWWNMSCAVSATSLGLLDEAIRYAELSQSQSPQFQPPKRYLAALYSAKGWEEKTAETVSQIRTQEPEFAPIQLAEDPAYPSSVLRFRKMFNIDILRGLS